MPVHQEFRAGLDTKPYEAGLSRMESETRRSTQKTAKEFDRVQSSASRSGRGANVAGGIALQAQDVAVQLQTGASAARVIAQQGSQIASLFGPGGAIVGGLIAITALIWESVRGSKEMTKEAKEQAALEKQRAQTREANKVLDQLRADKTAIAVAEARMNFGKEEADQVERRLQLEEKIAAIRNNADMSPENKEVAIDSLRERANAEERARTKERVRKENIDTARARGQEILDRADQIRGKGPSKSEVRREEREQRAAERRAKAEELDEADRAERNQLEGTRGPRTKGLSDKEKREKMESKDEAVKAAKEKNDVKISDESINKILTGIDKMVTR